MSSLDKAFAKAYRLDIPNSAAQVESTQPQQTASVVPPPHLPPKSFGVQNMDGSQEADLQEKRGEESPFSETALSSALVDVLGRMTTVPKQEVARAAQAPATSEAPKTAASETNPSSPPTVLQNTVAKKAANAPTEQAFPKDEERASPVPLSSLIGDGQEADLPSGTQPEQAEDSPAISQIANSSPSKVISELEAANLAAQSTPIAVDPDVRQRIEISVPIRSDVTSPTTPTETATTPEEGYRLAAEESCEVDPEFSSSSLPRELATHSGAEASPENVIPSTLEPVAPETRPASEVVSPLASEAVEELKPAVVESVAGQVPVQTGQTASDDKSHSEVSQSEPSKTADAELTPKVQETDPEWAPVWEVDSFRWPEICNELLSAPGDGLSDAGTRLRSAAEEGLKSLVVTSSHRGEGKTTLVLSLARTAVAAGLSVAIVDADCEHPQLAHQLGLEPPCSWDQVLDGGCLASEAAVVSLTDKVTLVPLAGKVAKSLTMTDPHVRAFIDQLRVSYDLVLYDIGPVDGDGTLISPSGGPCPFDAAVIVRDVRQTDSRMVEEMVQRIQLAGIEAVGVAENFVNQQRAAA